MREKCYTTREPLEASLDFCYIYRTSDNQKHRGEISAPSHAEAYAALRQNGIKPIKVFPKEAMVENLHRIRRLNRILIACGVLGGLVVGVLVAYSFRRSPPAPAAAAVAEPAVPPEAGRREEAAAPPEAGRRKEVHAAFTNLTAQADAVKSAYDAAIANLDLDLLRNYALVANQRDLSVFTNEIAKARVEIAGARTRVKDLFRDIFDIFPPECLGEREDAQRLYGTIMTAIDLTEERIDNDESALYLLHASRDRWRVKRGRIEFSDKRLEDEFRFYSKSLDASTSRWRQDFAAPGALESAPVELKPDGTFSVLDGEPQEEEKR